MRASDIITGAHHQNLQYEIPASIFQPSRKSSPVALNCQATPIFCDARLVAVGKGLKLQSRKVPYLPSTVITFWAGWIGSSILSICTNTLSTSILARRPYQLQPRACCGEIISYDCLHHDFRLVQKSHQSCSLHYVHWVSCVRSVVLHGKHNWNLPCVLEDSPTSSTV